MLAVFLCSRWHSSCSINVSMCSAPHRLVLFLLRTEPSALPSCSGQIMWSDLCLGVSVHVWLLICVTAAGSHWSGFQVIPALIQITSQMMINCFFSLTCSRRTKAMNFECDKRWNSFSTTIRSGLPEHSRSLSLLLCESACSLNLWGWANPTTHSAL